MFSKKTYVVLYLRSSSLEFYDTESGETRIFDFPGTVIKNSKVKNREAFEVLLSQFMGKAGYAKRAGLVILGEDVLYEKKIAIEEQDKVEELLEDSSIDKEHRVYKVLKTSQDVYIVATNKELYESVVTVLSDIGWDIHLVVPVTLFVGTEKKEGFSQEELKKIIKNISLLKVGNFLNKDIRKDTPNVSKKEAEVVVKEEEKKEKKEEKKEEKEVSPHTESSVSTEDVFGVDEKRGFPKKYILILILAIFILIFGFAFLLMRAGYFSLPTGNPFAKPTPTPTSAPTATPTPTSLPSEDKVDKKGIVVQIFNGTGTPGQALKVKNALTELGFETINTGNSDTTDATDALVVFSAKVGSVTREEVTKAMHKIFESVVTKGEEDADFDIKITTGKELSK